MKSDTTGRFLDFFRLSVIALFAVFLVVAICCPGSAFAESSSTSSEESCDVTISGTYHQTEAYSMLAMVNEFRTATPDTNNGNTPWLIDQSGNKNEIKGLSALEWDYGLEKLAMKRAAEIAVKFDHTRPNGESCYSVTDDFPFESEIWGENISAGYWSAKDAFVGWREDDKPYEGQGHRQNMLRDWSWGTADGRIAIACFEVNGICYWAMEFGVSDVVDEVKRCDGGQNVAVSLLSSKIILGDVESVSASIQVGQAITLPNSVNLKVYPVENNRWFAANLSCSLGDQGWKFGQGGNLVAISGSAITALKPGSVVFKATALGKTVSFTVSISEKKSSTATTAAKVSAPAKTSISKLVKAKKSFTVKWKKKSGVTGYQVRYSLKSSMKGAKAVKVKSAKTVSKKVKKLKKKKKYYVQVRTYKVVNGKTYWSGWSAKKSVKTK